MQLPLGHTSDGPLHRKFLCLCVMILSGMLLAIAPSQCQADSPLITVFEGPKVPAHLIVTVEPLFNLSPGYNPVRVVMLSMVNNPVRTFGVPVVPGPAPRDRLITFTIEGRDYFSGWDNSPSVTGTLLIPKGALQAETIINVPVYRSPFNSSAPSWCANSIALSEGGKAFRDSPYFTTPVTTTSWGGRGVSTDTNTTFLFIHNAVPDAATRQKIRDELGRPTGPVDPNTQNIPAIDRLMQHWFPAVIGITAKRNSDWQMIQSLKEVPTISLLPPSEIPDEWSQLSGRSVIVISQNDLTTLAKNHPTKVKAIHDWLRTGTGLVVYGVQENFKRIPELEKSLGIPSLEVVNSLKPSEPFDRSKWQPLDRTLEHAEFAEDTSGRRNRNLSSTPIDPQESKEPEAGDGTTLFDARARAVGLGLLVAIDVEDPFTNSIPANIISAAANSTPPPQPTPPGMGAAPGSPVIMSESALTDRWQLVFNNIGGHRLRWESRADMNLTQSCNFFWNMLIPGVGAAPVVSFMVLVTFFALVIGPFNFAWVRKRKQAVLILITVPLAGVVTTVFLFAYALSKDGVVTRSRIRSFTHLDQKTRSATSWSRQTYYAAIAPSQGYEFSEKDVVFPIIGGGARRNYYNEMENYSVEFKKEKQFLSRDFLKSRTFSQLLVIHSGETESQLIVTPPKGDQAPKATNRLASHIQLLLIRDQQGKYYEAKDISLGATQDLKLVDAPKPLEVVRRAIADKPLGLPEGLDPNNLDGGLFGNNYAYYGYGNNQLSGVNIGHAVMDSYGDDSKRPKTYQTGKLQNGEFIALVSGPQDVPQGIANSQERESLHCITGNW